MDLKVFFATFVTIFLAELGDKTQFAAMAAGASGASLKTILPAVVLGLGVAGALGVLAGRTLGSFLNPDVMKYVSGGLFIAVGVWILLAKK
jgi:putative Ca2+/H+ antiporter (TMEM165/GDT1 family)